MASSELEILAFIRDRFPGGRELVDDCGALPSPPAGESLLTTTDLMEEGVHFHPAWHPPELLGRKLLAVNLSDLDASGARPLGFLLTLALPRGLDDAWLRRLLEGLAGAAQDQGIPILGGDTVGRREGIGLGLTAFGSARRWLKRDGLRPGDGLFVDQPLGRSLRGLRKLQAGVRWNPAAPDPELAAHLDPRPNLGLGLQLAELPEVHACLDLSDGLSKDARWMAEASDVSIELDAALDLDAIQGGEDYARCFGASLHQDELEALLGLPLIHVGRVVAREEQPLFFYDGGQRRPLSDLSFDHFR
ncbi:MAG TPA: thiamine-phosphate kinase [Holophagaceae bacterium]|nr:thiamine-phosphate kinase [Holophagaceae bacterium]